MGVNEPGTGSWSVELVVFLVLVVLLVRIVSWFVDRRRDRQVRERREVWEEQAAVWWGEQPRAASEVDDAR